jgi:hypothetical protein
VDREKKAFRGIVRGLPITKNKNKRF